MTCAVDPGRELTLLHGLIRAAADPGAAALPVSACGMIAEATGADACVVHVLDDAGRALRLAAATTPFDRHVGVASMPLGSGIAGWVASHRTPVLIADDIAADPRYLPTEPLRGTGFRSLVSVPMESGAAGLAGELSVYSLTPRQFGDRDIELLSAVGHLVAGSMQQVRLQRQQAARERAHDDFVEQVIEAQEVERRRLASDIHDGISQRLITLSYRLDAAARAMSVDLGEAALQVREARGLVRLTLEEARAAITGLRPPVLDDLGLAGGLASLARSIPQLESELDLAEVRLPEHIELALYRIAQEGLQNVVKHAAARSAGLRFSVSLDTAILEIADDGIGFTVGDRPPGRDDRGGYGLLSMAERAELVGGRLHIRSRPGTGTTVTAVVPLPGAPDSG